MYLKEFREKTGLSQRDFAEKLGLTQVTIARYETDKMNPTSAVIQKYFDVFDANPLYIFLGIEPVFLKDQKELNREYIVNFKMQQIEQLKKEVEYLKKGK